MSAPFIIRPIRATDAEATLAIYAPYVQNTIISFEYEVPTLSDWENRIRTNTNDYPWLVCEHNGQIVGYAYGSKHRYRTAYSWSPESTIYLAENYHGRGIAVVLYQTLFSLLRLQGYFNVYAGVGLPNKKSESFHQALGFEEIGIFKKVGYKLGNWHDTRWFQLHLANHPQNPPFPQKLADVKNTDAFRHIIERANNQLNEINY
jgi:phosphinothricin acetyltransferase